MRRTIAAIGRILVTLGLLILLFVTYELWGTGFFTARAQSDLKQKFEQRLGQQFGDNPVITVPTPNTPSTRPTPTTINPDFLVPPPAGEVAGVIEIPKIGVKKFFVEDVRLKDLAKGPGHYPGTPLPGQIGNAAIAGHRTTYGAPFNRINELAKGDRIVVTTFAGKYTYQVYRDPFIVEPKQYSVVGPPPTGQPAIQLTLTSCHPKYSAAERIIVKAKLVVKRSTKAVAPPKVHRGKRILPPKPEQLETNLKGQANSIVPSYFFGAVVAMIGFLWWWAFRRWRHPLTWAIGLIPFLIALIPFFVYVERGLPAGY